MFRRLACLTLLLLAPAATAQWTTVPLPGNGGYIAGHVLIPMDWEGKPAFLVWIGGVDRPFLGYDSLAPIPSDLKFRPVAGYFQDPRACAVNQPVVIRSIGDGGSELVQHDFGDLGPDGTLFSMKRGTWAFRRSAPPAITSFFVQLCTEGNQCLLLGRPVPPTACYRPAWPTGLSAFVLVVE